jgi:ferredoxin/flavodoxin---NADP+ reductase
VAFVIASGCCNDASCVEVCPVDCIRPHPEDPAFRTAEQLYIAPDSCIGCAACMYACPVAAIHDEADLPAELSDYAGLNADYFLEQPLLPRFLHAPRPAAIEPLAARVAVVGAGPSACYAIAELSTIPGVELTVFDRLPTPFGLVRSGVAPDHPGTKLVGDYFQSVLELPNVTCCFHVEVGTDVTLEELRASHHAVIWAGGATEDRKLGIEGETLPGSHSARELVSWYNAHPDLTVRTFDLSGETAVVIGNGNVAMDVARVLTRPADDLASTDVSEPALEALRRSAIREVVVVARRGPADAACTFSELEELGRVPGVEVRVPIGDLEARQEQDASLPWSIRRKLELFRHWARRRAGEPSARRITFRFGLEPVRISGSSAVESLWLRPTGSPDAPFEVIETGLVLRAVGYEVAPVAGLAFDESSRTIAHVGGRVLEHVGGAPALGLYCVGWAKRGPTGVIGTNKSCSQETVAAVVDDLRAGRLPTPSISTASLDEAIRARQRAVVTVAGWKAIDSRERREGQSAAPPKPRRKFVRIGTMLSVAGIPDPTPTGESLLCSDPASTT